MKNLEQIRKYLIDNVFTDPDIMFSDDRDKKDLPEIIASLYEVLHRSFTGEPYEYMFHWANKIGSWVDNDLFMDTEEPKTGHWIPIYQGDEIINYRCSECELGDTNGSTNLYGWDYCRRCGAKMIEPQEV